MKRSLRLCCLLIGLSATGVLWQPAQASPTCPCRVDSDCRCQVIDDFKPYCYKEPGRLCGVCVC